MKTANEKIPLDNGNFILRGCALRNTEWVIGLVCYTGHQTKVMINSVKPRAKVGSMERLMYRSILAICLLQIVLCTLGSIIYLIWYGAHKVNTFSLVLSLLFVISPFDFCIARTISLTWRSIQMMQKIIPRGTISLSVSAIGC